MNSTYNIRINSEIREEADALLSDAAEIDAAIKSGAAKIYDNPHELFSSWNG